MTRTQTPRAYVGKVALGLFVALIVSYGMFSLHSALSATTVTVAGLSENTTVTNPVIELSGSALHALEVIINGHHVPLETSGAFRDTIVVPDGYSVVTVEAAGRDGKTVTKQYPVYYKQ